MALGKISVVFILFVSFLSFRAMAKTDQEKANNGCQKWCDTKTTILPSTAYCKKNAYSTAENKVACNQGSCRCGGFDFVNHYLIDENGEEI